MTLTWALGLVSFWSSPTEVEESGPLEEQLAELVAWQPKLNSL